jgi:YVTN family beta-propeller protein
MFFVEYPMVCRNMKNRLSLFILVIVTCSFYLQAKVITIDLLKHLGVTDNGIGPVLIKSDDKNGRLLVANTLSSTISIIDANTDAIRNIPFDTRAFQHLKNEALTFNNKTGAVALIGTMSFSVVEDDWKFPATFSTEYQFESIAFDDDTRNIFLAGRESKYILMFEPKTSKQKQIPWTETSEKLINMNQTPPPPLRKVVAATGMKKIVAIDGFTSTIYFINPVSGEIESSRKVAMTSGGRWHLAAYDPLRNAIYIVTEKKDRKVIEAGKIDLIGGKDVIIKLPEYTEGVGMTYHPELEQVIIPYDNHASVHIVDFKKGGELREIPIPTFGNDASAIDFANNMLYIGSWAHGQVEVIDLAAGKFVKSFKNLGIIPHMFAMAYSPVSKSLYYPVGASAVNGTFGAAITKLNVYNEEKKKIYLGWAPIDIIELKERKSMMIFNNEDGYAEIKYDGSTRIYTTPYDFPVKAVNGPENKVYLSYGPHQSYWPVVYIWGARNGILKINSNKMETEAKKVIPDRNALNDFFLDDYYDRRLPRQGMQMISDKNGKIYMTQNNWGKEPQFLTVVKDGVRYPDINERIQLGDSVERETTQRILRYDQKAGLLYLTRVAENDTEPGILQIISADSNKLVKRLEVGRCPSDLIWDDKSIYVSNFESNSVSVINRQDYSIRDIKTGEGPLRLMELNGDVWVINHIKSTVQNLTKDSEIDLKQYGIVDNIYHWNTNVILSVHSKDKIKILSINPANEEIKELLTKDYHYGDTRYNTLNSSFYMNGQYGDAIFDICKMTTDQNGNLWVTDFISGKVYIISN